MPGKDAHAEGNDWRKEKKCGKLLDCLLENERVHLTITTGRDAELKAELQDRFRSQGARVQVLGWTNQMAVASHPHVFKSEWGKNTLCLWED